ncbi:MAG: cytochrome bc complex cytochrome b subunit [Candidatus Aminicenantales bacterium]
MKKLAAWFNDCLGLPAISAFMAKKEVPQHQHTIWYYTGSSILLFLGIQIVTGIMLALYYKPTLEGANASVAKIMTGVPLGWIVRSVHSLSASCMIAIVMVHMVAILLTKSYRKPRELTWMSGVLLLVCSMGFGFTGYLLPWDDLSLAATKVGTNIPKAIPFIGDWAVKFLRGGEDVTGDTLTRFFIFHVCLLPLVILLVLAFHLFVIQRHGISVPLEAEKKNVKVPSLPFWPNFVLRESLVWIVLLGCLVTAAVIFAPALGPAANLMAPAPAGIKPEWYFLFLFQTLKIFPANVLLVTGEALAVLFILAAVVLIFFLPLIDTKPAEKRGKVITVIAYLGLAYAVAMTVWSLL